MFQSGLSGNILLQSRLNVDHNLTIQGPSNLSINIQGDGAFEDIYIPSTKTVTLENLVLSHGSGDHGSGVKNLGTLTIDHCTLSGNMAADGGGIFNTGTVTITDSVLSGNTANKGNYQGSGGAIYNAKTGTVSISGSSTL